MDNFNATTMSRVPTLISLNQLADYSPLDEMEGASPPRVEANLVHAMKPCKSTVASITRDATPCYLFPACRMPNAVPPLSAERLAASQSEQQKTMSDSDGENDSNSDTQLYGIGEYETESASGEYASTLGQSAFDDILLSHWEDRAELGLFRYDVTECATKVLPGELGFVAQLNEGRALKKRPTEFAIDQVAQPFDPTKFNFNKAGINEVLFTFGAATGIATSKYNEIDATIDGLSADLAVDSPMFDPNLVLINVSPIEYGHVLLVPSVLSCLEQKLTLPTFRLALEMIREADNPDFRIGFNSLGAFATINHLHFQAYYLSTDFACERATLSAVTDVTFVPPSPEMNAACPMESACGGAFEESDFSSVHICTLADYPVRGMCFYITSIADIAKLAAVVSSCCERMHDANIPHNVFVCDRGLRAFVFPQCFAARQAAGEVPESVLATGVNPAVFEISGHLVLKRKEDYDNADETWARNILSEVSLDAPTFSRVVSLMLTGK